MAGSNRPAPADLSGKEPWLATNLSRIFPGIGQIYAGQALKGWAIVILTTLLYLAGGWLVLSSGGGIVTGLILFLAATVVGIINLFDAHKTARRANTTEFERQRKQSKDPWLAFFLSQIIPGLGHAYLKKWLTATVLFILFIAIAIIQNSKNLGLAGLASLISVAIALLVPYHAYVSSPVRRERSKKAVISLIVFSLAAPVILALLIRNFIAEARYIPASSMSPTLQVNDRLVVNKLIYRFQQPQRGDVVVFAPTEALRNQNFNDAFVKRIIGLPGDKVEIKGGQVYINGQPYQETYLQEKPQYTWGPQTVPAGSYFVLGDNRNNSYDSHYWGFVPRDHIIGKVMNIFYPFNRVGSIY